MHAYYADGIENRIENDYIEDEPLEVDV